MEITTFVLYVSYIRSFTQLRVSCICIPTCLFLFIEKVLFENVCSLSSDFAVVLYSFLSLATSTTVFQYMKIGLVTKLQQHGTHLMTCTNDIIMQNSLV